MDVDQLTPDELRAISAAAIAFEAADPLRHYMTVSDWVEKRRMAIRQILKTVRAIKEAHDAAKKD